MKRIGAFQIVILVGMLTGLTLLYVKSQAGDPRTHHQRMMVLQQLKQIEATLNQDILKVHAGLLAHYDPLVHASMQLRRGHDLLAKGPLGIVSLGAPELVDRIKEYDEALGHQDSLLDAFKSQQAILKNSQQYFPYAAKAFIQELSQRDSSSAFVHDAEQLLQAMLMYLNQHEVNQRDAVTLLLKKWRSQQSQMPLAFQDDIKSVVDHGMLILDYAPRVKSLVADLMQDSSSQILDDLTQTYLRHSFSMTENSNTYRSALYVLGVMFVSYVGFLFVRLQRLTQDLNQLNTSLEKRVEERTAELVASKESLESEILERKQIETNLIEARDLAESATKAKTQFLSTMSHEIRTPMNGVIGMTSLLIDSDLTEEQLEMVETIRQSGESLLVIINDILDFSKIEAGKMEFERVSFDLREVLDQIQDLFAERAAQNQVELVGIVASSVPSLVMGDPTRVRQVLTNLVGNALKFTQRGEVAVFVTVDGEPSDSTTVRFDIVDTGVGMTDQDQSRLFQSFSQVDSSTTRKFGGTGLGLAICQRLVHLMHGTIGVDSEAGRGSRFWFTVPLDPAKLQAVSPPCSNAVYSGLRVCLVDDNGTNLTLLEQYATNFGLRYAVAWNGSQALELMRTAAKQGDAFSLAIVDYHMPAMDGGELLNQIRVDPLLGDMPVVGLVSTHQRGESSGAKESGIVVSVAKPIRQGQLHRALEAALGSHDSGDHTALSENPLLPRQDVVEVIQAGGHLRVLLVEDNEVNQKVAVRMLEKLGVQVDVVKNGHEAIRAWQATPYDAIFMDCHMPEMDGYEATKEIREEEKNRIPGGPEGDAHLLRETGLPSERSLLPFLSRVPIIALTASALLEDQEKCLEVGMDDFLPKPVKVEVLKGMLSKWIPQDKWEKANASRDKNLELFAAKTQ